MRYPGAQKDRRALLERAAQGYRRIAEKLSADGSRGQQYGTMWLRVGDIDRGLADADPVKRLAYLDHAAQSYAEAVQSFRGLKQSHSGERDLAIATAGLARVRTDQGRTSEAEMLFHKAIERLRHLVEMDMDNASLLYEEAAVLADLADLLVIGGQLRDAQPGMYSNAITSVLDNKANLLWENMREQEARSSYRTVVLLREKLIDDTHHQDIEKTENLHHFQLLWQI